MRRHVSLALAIVVGISGHADAADSPGARIARDFARPALTAFVASARAAGDAISKLCASPSPDALAAARKSFAPLAESWGRASVLRFGPLAAETRFERIFFWPDTRGVVLKQVQQLASSTEPFGDLADKSAAVQGLPALDIALFATGSETMAEPSGKARCELASMVAANVALLGGQAEDGWADAKPFADSFTDPGDGKDPYRTAAEVDGEVIKALATVIEYVRSAELLPALGETPDAANGKRTPIWRSGASFGLVAAQIEGAIDLLAASGLDERLAADRSWVAQSIRFELRNGVAALRKVTMAPEAAFADPEARGRIAFANLALDHAEHLVKEDLPAALGLKMGFNALDGD